MNTTDAQLQPPRAGDPSVLGRHRVIGRLGSGGMGVVYLAEGPFGRVAVKLVREELADDPDFRRRFQREVQACFRVGGSRTARLVDFELDADRPWLATEFVDAPNLAAHVRGRGPLRPDDQVVLAAGLAEALVSIHAAGMIHRDLKPSNVLWTSHGPKVIDFGIAAAADAVAITLSGQFVGTPGWHSPEQVSGAEATPAADIFAWGTLLCYAATGEAPFGSGAGQAVLHRVLLAEPAVDVARLAPPLRELVASAMARQPTDRPSAVSLFTSLVGPLPEGEDGPVTRFLQTRPSVSPTPPWSATIAPSKEQQATPPDQTGGSPPGTGPEVTGTDGASPGPVGPGDAAPGDAGPSDAGPGDAGPGDAGTGGADAGAQPAQAQPAQARGSGTDEAAEPASGGSRRRSRPGRGRRLLIPAVVALLLAAGGGAAALLVLDGDDAADIDTVFTATEPWRLHLDDEREDSSTGCETTVTNTVTGESTSITDVYGSRTYQVSQVGTFRFDVSESGCVAEGEEGSGDATLPFAHESYTGDTDAFHTEGTVTVEILDFGGGEECELTLHAAADGRMLHFVTAHPDEGPVSLDVGGSDQVYLAEPGCGIRVLAP